MIQINLLPDVKREYLRSQQVKHAVLVGSVLVTLVSVTFLVLLFAYVQVVQPQHRKNLQKNIDSGISELKHKKDAVKIVTVQGALEQVSGLEDKKNITSRMFDYLKSFTPRNVSYSQVTLDLTAGTLSLGGSTSDYESANVLANNLKSAKFSYTEDSSIKTIQPFSGVVFQSLGSGSTTGSAASVSFQLSFTVDPILFKQGLTAPSITVNAASDQLLLPTSQLFTNQTTSGAKQ
jgi:Tfp pilus assembly protein PilN